jgi:DNA polymerase III epsilon subunit family exonuclease
MRYVVLDIETTGLSPNYHKITEIGAVKVKDGKIKERYEQLIHPREKIPSFITRLTGIDDEMVKNAPPIEKALPEFLKFVGDDAIVGHNVSFDHRFLSQNAKNIELPFANEALCTKKLSTRLIPDLPSRRLGSICAHLNIPHENAHRAMPDVLVTHELFLRLHPLLETYDIKTLEDTLAFQNLSMNKVRKLYRSQKEPDIHS